MNSCITYRLFLYILTQLSTVGMAKIFICGYDIFFTVENVENWLISTKIKSFLNKNTFAFKELFQNRINSKIYFSNSYLTLDSGINLNQNVIKINKYKKFSILMKNYLEEVNDWKEILAE